jgi:hypothetical protein
MRNRPDRGGTGRSGRRSATSAAISRAHAVRHSARTLRIAGGGGPYARAGPCRLTSDHHLGTSTSARTVFPGGSRSSTSHRSATASTTSRPRPDSARGNGGRASLGPGGHGPLRLSVTSIRTLPVTSPSRSSKSRPGTRPWVTAFAAQLGDDQRDGLGDVRAVRDTPGVQLTHGEVPGKAGAARGGAQALGEHTYGNRALGG